MSQSASKKWPLKTSSSKRHGNYNGFRKSRLQNKPSRAGTFHATFWQLGENCRRWISFWRPLDFEGVTKIDSFWKQSKTDEKNGVQIEIFQATITSRLLCGLSSARLNVAERRRLEEFQSRCLPKILEISSAYVSRVSNRTILQEAQQK